MFDELEPPLEVAGTEVADEVPLVVLAVTPEVAVTLEVDVGWPVWVDSGRPVIHIETRTTRTRKHILRTVCAAAGRNWSLAYSNVEET